MKSRKVLIGGEAQRKLAAGAQKLAEIVSVTLGPNGRTVFYTNNLGLPIPTKDGVTVARAVFLDDIIEDLGAQSVKEVALKTNEIAGDGTTTATVLANALIQEGLKAVSEQQVNPVLLKRGIDAGVAEALDIIQKVCVKNVDTPDDIRYIATISGNNDPEIGELIAEAMQKVGENGIITLEESKSVNTEIEMSSGMQFDRGYYSGHFINNLKKFQVELENVAIFIYSGKLTNVNETASILTKALNSNTKQTNGILIIADDFSPEVLQLLVVNRLKQDLPVVAVLSPGVGERRGDLLKDIGISTGGKVFYEGIDKDLLNILPEDLGYARKVTVTRDRTMLIEGEFDEAKLQERVSQIREQINTATTDYDRSKLEDRLGKLIGGVAVIRVGASTQAELKEKKDRIEDALNATRVAVNDGFVPGAGKALCNASLTLAEHLQDPELNTAMRISYEILTAALLEPALQILENAGKDVEAIFEKIKLNKQNPWYGFNAVTEEFGDMHELGVIDPYKVVSTALLNAASIAGMFITTGGIVAASEKEKEYIDKLMLTAGN